MISNFLIQCWCWTVQQKYLGLILSIYGSRFWCKDEILIEEIRYSCTLIVNLLMLYWSLWIVDLIIPKFSLCICPPLRLPPAPPIWTESPPLISKKSSSRAQSAMTFSYLSASYSNPNKMFSRIVPLKWKYGYFYLFILLLV